MKPKTRIIITIICVGICLTMKVIWWDYPYQSKFLDMWSIARSSMGLGLGVISASLPLSVVGIFAWEFYEILENEVVWVEYALNNFFDLVVGCMFAMLGVGLFR